ncbi:hypothetical protein SAMN04487957_110117 [Halomonas shengliensis]|uniref:Uncharacterized protein n=1 Tax=Halomonas shengliensis TaxID=419597 RepID=A0A1H0LUW9_9GAMM|nr:hypothetical protein [Halomonas shengliensis]SDO71998.1 hypothetical protein SAMN04487957_110117 [Halomonas shengliensis]
MTTETKGGGIARQAAMLCEEPAFRLYLDHRRRQRLSLTRQQLPDGTHTGEDAADAIRQACGVNSRAQLDHLPEAASMFGRIVRDFHRWRGRVGQ